jgi:Zn-finger nucleic acid-binding protein
MFVKLCPMEKIAKCEKCQQTTNAKYLEIGQKFQCLCGHWNIVASVNADGKATPSKADALAQIDTKWQSDAKLNALQTFCHKCFAKVGVNMHCENCQALVEIPPPPPPNTLKYDCPVCGPHHSLFPHRFPEINASAFECGSCHGLWMDTAGFERFLNFAIHNASERYASLPKSSTQSESQSAATPQSPVSQEGPFYRKCLLCKNLMHRENFANVSGTIIDICRGHGVWLDAMELGNLYKYVMTQETLKASRIIVALR